MNTQKAGTIWKGVKTKVRSLINRFKRTDSKIKMGLLLLSVLILMSLSFYGGTVYSNLTTKEVKDTREVPDKFSGEIVHPKTQFILGTVIKSYEDKIVVRDKRDKEVTIVVNEETTMNKDIEIKEGDEVIIKAQLDDDQYTAQTVTRRSK